MCDDVSVCAQCVSLYTCLSSQYGDSALTLAARNGYTKVVEELIKAGVNLNLQNEVQSLSILCIYVHIQYASKKCP